MNKNMSTQNTISAKNISRRSVLRTSGLVAASGAFLAACKKSSVVAIPRLGTVPPTTALPQVSVSDVALLRTAASVENSATAAINSLIKAGNLSSEAAALATAFVAAHTANAATLASAISAQGGEAITGTNANVDKLYFNPALALIDGGADKAGDSALLLMAIESYVTETYQYFVSLTNAAVLRAQMMKLGSRTSRQSAATAQLIRGGTKGFLPGVDDKGVALVATINSAFGQLSAVQVSLGKVSEAGTKAQISMETPSLNSLEY